MSTPTVLDYERFRELVTFARAYYGGGPAAALDDAINNELVGLCRGEQTDVNFFHELRLAHEVAIAGGILADNGMAGRPNGDIFDVALHEVLSRRAS
jgi:hypothetical protein